ncbi:hypothetical protein Adt_41037 [Abeliophyllum distichum]|uniref:Uncharacterized protein n=1 Tax=Abeliophyllum distichum TaxID=126358 RepID=A0ABD1PMP5_9LAMI
MLPAQPSIVAASVHMYWTPNWEKPAKEATVCERLQLVEVNLARGFVLAKELFSAFESFDTEEAKSKKLAKNLKAMGLEKAQLESDKRALQFKLDLVVTKKARDQRRAAEASLKRAEEAQKSVETALASANSSLEAAVADKEKSLAAAKFELERVRAERADAEAKAVEVYQDVFVDIPEYQDLTQHLMTVGREQLVEQIIETHPEWDISFLREAPTEAHASEAVPSDNRDRDEGHRVPTLKEAVGHLN